MPEGRVSLVGRVVGGADLMLTWTERGGPAIQPPDHQGFGLRTLAATVEYQLEGRLELDWEPEGLRCAITLPLARLAVQP